MTHKLHESLPEINVKFIILSTRKIWSSLLLFVSDVSKVELNYIVTKIAYFHGTARTYFLTEAFRTELAYHIPWYQTVDNLRYRCIHLFSSIIMKYLIIIGDIINPEWINILMPSYFRNMSKIRKPLTKCLFNIGNTGDGVSWTYLVFCKLLSVLLVTELKKIKMPNNVMKYRMNGFSCESL